MFAIAWTGRRHPKNLITQGGVRCLRALLIQGLQGLQKSPKASHDLMRPAIKPSFSGLASRSVSPDQLRQQIAELYSTPAMAASTASMSAPKSRPSEAAPAPGETLGQPSPFSWQSLGSLLTPFLRSRMPAASGDPTMMFPLGNDPRPLMIRFLSN